jgi:hypothetical protein
MPHVALSTRTLHRSLGTGLTVDGRELEDAQVFVVHEGDEVNVDELTKEQQQSVIDGHLSEFVVEVTASELKEIQAKRDEQLAEAAASEEEVGGVVDENPEPDKPKVSKTRSRAKK